MVTDHRHSSTNAGTVTQATQLMLANPLTTMSVTMRPPSRQNSHAGAPKMAARPVPKTSFW